MNVHIKETNFKRNFKSTIYDWNIDIRMYIHSNCSINHIAHVHLLRIINAISLKLSQNFISVFINAEQIFEYTDKDQIKS